mgnify:CR=1 FL=1
MPSRYKRTRERREPEKTPLIDVIFLFLIFFFVTITGLDLELLPGQEDREVGAERRLELLEMENPVETPPDTLDRILLLQIQKAGGIPPALLRELNTVIESVQQLGREFENAEFGQCSTIPPGKPDRQYIVLFLNEEYPDVSALYDLSRDLRTALSNYRASPGLDSEARIRRLVTRHMPVSFPARGVQDFDRQYQKGMGEFRRRLRQHYSNVLPESELPEIHIRMEKTMYVKFIDELFELCNEEGIDRRSLKFRVLEQRT